MGISVWSALWNSRKVRVALVDAFFSTVTVLATALLSPAHTELALTVVAIWQPVFVVVIGGIAYEDGQQKRAQLWLEGERLEGEPEDLL